MLATLRQVLSSVRIREILGKVGGQRGGIEKSKGRGKR
jgi:hypothetical protein